MADAAKVQGEVRALKGVVDKLSQKLERKVLVDLCKQVDQLEKSLSIVGQRAESARIQADSNWGFLQDAIKAIATLRTEVKALQTAQTQHRNEIAWLKAKLKEESAALAKLRADHLALYKQVEGFLDEYLAFRKQTEARLDALERQAKAKPRG